MRLTVINQYYAPDLSPTAGFATGLAEHRARAGDEVTVVAGSGGYAGTPMKSGRDERNGVTVWRVRVPGRSARGLFGRAVQYLSFYALGLWRLLRLPRQDVIVTLTTPPFVPLLAVLARRLRHRDARIVQWTADCYPDILEAAGLLKPGGLIARRLHRVTRYTLRRLDHVVVSDEAMHDRLDEARAMSIIPMFEPWDRFPAAPQSVSPWPGYKRLGLDERFTVLFIGNAGWGHDFTTLLDAAEELRNEPVSLLFVGGGVGHEWIRREAERRSLTDVHLHPYVEDAELPGVVAGAGVGVAVLADEAVGSMSPCKIHTYFALGLPVLYIGPTRSNVDHAVQSFRCGGSFRHGDADGVASFILEAKVHRDLEMRRRARHAFETAYSDRCVLPQMDGVIDTLRNAA